MTVMPESKTLPRVTESSELEITFKLSLVDETIVEQTEEGEVFHFRIGDGQFIHNLEALLIGLEEGTIGKFTLPPEQAFGYPDAQNIQTMNKADFPVDMVLQEGFIIGFNTPTGEEVPGTIDQVGETEVVVDFNHPLSGQTLYFEVNIQKVLS